VSAVLPLLARLSEACSYPKAVRAYEPDPWGYLRRKLDACEAPLREIKNALFERAKAALLRDLDEPFLKPGALLEHKEAFDRLLPVSDFADLAFHLEPGADRKARREGAAQALAHAKPVTLFDLEALPDARRGKAWEALVEESGRRLGLPLVLAVIRRGPTERRRALAAARVRRRLGEFLAITRGEAGVREEIGLFALTRVEGAIAACRRLLSS
jgi:hypothetical protein